VPWITGFSAPTGTAAPAFRSRSPHARSIDRCSWASRHSGVLSADWEPVSHSSCPVPGLPAAVCPPRRVLLGISPTDLVSWRLRTGPLASKLPLLADAHPQELCVAAYGVYDEKAGRALARSSSSMSNCVIHWSKTYPAGVNPGVDANPYGSRAMSPMEAGIDGSRKGTQVSGGVMTDATRQVQNRGPRRGLAGPALKSGVEETLDTLHSWWTQIVGR